MTQLMRKRAGTALPVPPYHAHNSSATATYSSTTMSGVVFTFTCLPGQTPKYTDGGIEWLTYFDVVESETPTHRHVTRHGLIWFKHCTTAACAKDLFKGNRALLRRLPGGMYAALLWKAAHPKLLPGSEKSYGLQPTVETIHRQIQTNKSQSSLKRKSPDTDTDEVITVNTDTSCVCLRVNIGDINRILQWTDGDTTVTATVSSVTVQHHDDSTVITASQD